MLILLKLILPPWTWIIAALLANLAVGKAPNNKISNPNKTAFHVTQHQIELLCNKDSCLPPSSILNKTKPSHWFQLEMVNTRTQHSIHKPPIKWMQIKHRVKWVITVRLRLIIIKFSCSNLTQQINNNFHLTLQQQLLLI